MQENKMFKHLMVDIETMGNISYSSILSIGAVEFNIETGETGKTFYKTICLQSCLDIGLIINADTVIWWLGNDEKSRKELIERKNITIQDALNAFRDFCHMEYEIWGNSARFDLGLLQNAYNKLRIPIPWDFRKERCVRTLVYLAPQIKDSVSFVGDKHNALHDCFYQIHYCSETYKFLKNIK